MNFNVNKIKSGKDRRFEKKMAPKCVQIIKAFIEIGRKAFFNASGICSRIRKKKWSLTVLLAYKCMQNLDDAHVIKCFDIMTLDNNNRRNVALEHQFMVDRLIFLDGKTEKNGDTTSICF